MFFRRLMLVVLVFLAMLALQPTFAAGVCCTPFPPQQTQNLVLVPSTYTNAYVLVANTAQTAVAPNGANWAVFSAACNFFMTADGSTAAVPGSSVTDGSAATQNPTAWSLKLGTRAMSVVAAAACIVTVSFYQ